MPKTNDKRKWENEEQCSIGVMTAPMTTDPHPYHHALNKKRNLVMMNKKSNAVPHSTEPLFYCFQASWIAYCFLDADVVAGYWVSG
jgi:hypothetical protein